MENTVAVVPPGRTFRVVKGAKTLCLFVSIPTRFGPMRLSACIPRELAHSWHHAAMLAKAQVEAAVHQIAMDGESAADHGLPAVPVPNGMDPRIAATSLELAAKVADNDPAAINVVRHVVSDPTGRAAMSWAARAHLATGDSVGAGLPKIGASPAKKAQMAAKARGTKADYVRQILTYGARGQQQYDATNR